MAEHLWLLQKCGLYYRADDYGYTGIKDHAGRYTEAEACARMGGGVGRIREDAAPEFSEACFDDLARKHLSEQRDIARAEAERLRALLKDIAEFCSGDNRTLGAIERLAHIQNTAARAAGTQ